MALLCITGASGHFCLISALDTTHASTIQPFAYLQLVFASTIGILIFDDQLDRALIIGNLMIVGSGLFALKRERRAKLSEPHHRSLPWPAGRGADTATVIQQSLYRPSVTFSTTHANDNTLPLPASINTSNCRHPSPEFAGTI